MELNLGDTIGIISPSGPVYDREGFYCNVDFLKQKGFKVKVFPHALSEQNYLAGADKERLKDLHQAFCDDEVKAILCSRGGYGAIRLIDYIDYDLISQNKKIFIGSSDISILLALFYKKARLCSFHAPMLMNGFCSANFEKYLNIINNPKAPEPKKKHKIYKNGEARGVLWGGNLSSIISLFGSRDYLPDDEIILFLEDINEAPYKIDKMFAQIFRNIELKEKIKAVVLGEFSGLNKNDNLLLNSIFDFYSARFNVPFVFGYDITHNKNNTVVPFGRFAKLLGAKICLL